MKIEEFLTLTNQNGINYFGIVLLSLLAEYGYSMYLNYRQFKKYKIKKVPDFVKGRITDEEFIKSQEYSKAKLTFKSITSTIDILSSFICFYYPLYPYLWGLSLRIIQYFGYSHEILRSDVLFVMFIMMSSITEIPQSYYYQFVLEEKFGFNKMKIGLFIKDKVISNILVLLFGIPILSLMIYIINWAGPQLWLYCWGLVSLITLASITIVPNYIQPLFNKYTPVDGELGQEIYQLAERIGFPASKETIFVVDNSKRDGHMNAYFYGLFGKKRIVLYDTLIKELDTNEILAVLGHEIGHWKMKHSLKQMVFLQFYIVGFLYLFSLFLNEDKLYQQFGFESSKNSVFIGLILFSLLYSPIGRVFSLVLNVFSRRYEYQADNFAVQLGFLDCEHLYKLHFKENSCLVYDELFSAYHHSHPTLIERVKNIEIQKQQYLKNKKNN